MKLGDTATGPGPKWNPTAAVWTLRSAHRGHSAAREPGLRQGSGSAALRDNAEADDGRAMFLETSFEPIFTVFHAAHLRVQPRTGVVVCPLFGWEDLCTHRVRRAWAKAVSEAGSPAIRLDLPGTGDSAGSPRSSEQITRWTDAIGTAAAWLRREQGCARICCIGIGFGGMLAWLAAAAGAGVDDFILWGVPIKGRRLVREVRGAAMLSIDRRIDVDLVPEPHRPLLDEGDVLLDEAGQVTTADTIAALGRIDLTAAPLPDSAGRRVLIFQRDAVPDDDRLASHLRSTGVDVTAVSDAGRYDRLMQYVQKATLPDDIVASSISWLARAPRPSNRGRCAPSRVVRAASSIELVEDGEAIRETVVTFDLPSGRLCGLLTEPIARPVAAVSAAFFSGGSDRRIGPNRTWVTLARRWAAKGVVSVRLDPPGVGDSDGDERAWDDTRRHYENRHAQQVRELLDAMVARGLPDRFVLVGFCSGAFRIVEAAADDPRVKAVLGVGLMIFKWTWWTHNVRGSWLAEWTPGPTDSAFKVRLAAVLKLGVRAGQATQRRYLRALQFFPNRGERVLRRLSAQGTQVELMLKRSSYAYEQLTMGRRRERIQRLPGVVVSGLAGEDERFRPLVLQHAVQSAMDQALLEQIGPSAALAATAGVAAIQDVDSERRPQVRRAM